MGRRAPTRAHEKKRTVPNPPFERPPFERPASTCSTSRDGKARSPV